MNKILMLAALLVVALASIGCAGRNTLEITNQSDYDVTISQNGKPIKKLRLEDGTVADRLRPSQTMTVSIYNDANFVAKAWSDKQLVGVATFRKDGVISAYGYNGQSSYYGYKREYPENWVIESQDFNGGSYGNAIRSWLRRP